METKKCCRCKMPKSISEFGNNRRNKDGKQSYCKECGRESDRKHYRKNPKRKVAIRESNKNIRHTNSLFVWNYLKENPCVDCEEFDPVVLEFDHVRGEKVMPVCMMVQNYSSLERIEKEIAKCEVRCANCHRRKTAKQFGWHRHMPS